MDLIERFLKYVSFDTQSDEDSGICPSTQKQMVFAKYLKEELENIGLEDITLDENGYLFATLPTNVDIEVPVIGFIAHLDTSPDMSGENVNPRIVNSYDGGDIVLSKEDNIVLSPRQFPDLLNHKGEDLIVTDGKTLLGADDKAGIAEIVSAMVYLKNHTEIKHGKIRIGFNPDEEIGMGAHLFDVNKFGCQWAYTMDGGEVGESEYAKNKMLNSLLVANEFIAMLPKNETPETTEGYEGFYHLISVEGSVEKTAISYIIRDHDIKIFEKRKENMLTWVEKINAKYGDGTVKIELKDQYYNMREKVEPVKHIIDIAYKAMKDAGVEPKVKPIRGGTDGTQLSFTGIPCPNIFAGGINFHGKFEFVPVQSREKAMNVIIKIVEETATR